MPPKRNRSNRSKNTKAASKTNVQDLKPCSFSSRLNSFHKVYMFNGEPISYQTHAPLSLIPSDIRIKENGKLLTRSGTTVESTHSSKSTVQLHTPQQLAQLGFYYSPISIKHKYSITCSHCNMLIRDPIPAENDICEFHLSESPSCAFSLIWKFRNMKENNSTMWRKNPYFGVPNNSLGINIRKETFKQWKYEFPEVNQMASSGLYYDPLDDRDDFGDDRVVCMYCGLNLEQWERSDDPMEAHKLSNPGCWVFNFQDYKEEEKELDDVEISKPVESASNLIHDNDIPDFEPYENNPFSDGENYNNNFDEEEVEMGETEGHRRHSIESVTTTTTTTTNVMPIEIVDNDEVEEYLSNSQQYSEKMVDIPSIKSSELSQFFTEMDAESENDLGASYFANNKRKREKEREEREKLMSNVEPIPEEPQVNADLPKDNDLTNNAHPLEEVPQDEEDYENYQFDDFEVPEPDVQEEGHKGTMDPENSNTSTANEAESVAATTDPSSTDKRVEVDDSQHNISTSCIGNGSVDVEVHASEKEGVTLKNAIEKTVANESNESKAQSDYDLEKSAKEHNEASEFIVKENQIDELSEKVVQEDVAVDDIEEHQEEEEKVESENAELLKKQKEKEDEERQKEIYRVEKLEAELKFLKEQIAALQKSQSNTIKQDRVSDEITPISINESNIVTGEIHVKVENEESVPIKKEEKQQEKAKLKSKKKKKLKRKHNDENLLIRKSKKAKKVVVEEEDKMDVDVPVLDPNGSGLGKENKDPKVKIEESEDAIESEKGLHYSSSSVLEPISLFRSDFDSVLEQSPDAIPKKAESRDAKHTKGNERVESKFVSPMQVDDYEQSPGKHEEGGDLLVTPNQLLENNSIQAPLSSPVKQPKRSQKESIFSVPNFGKSTQNATDNSEIPTQADESQYDQSGMSIAKNHQEENNKKNDIEGHRFSGITKKEPMYSPNRDIDYESEIEDHDNTSPTMLRKNARSTPEEEVVATDLNNLIKNDTKRHKESVSTPNGDKDKSDKNERSPEKLFLGSDFLMDNQSTPHIAKVGEFSKDSKANFNSTPSLSPPTTEWQPIDGKKYFEFLKDIQEATSYVKEVLDSPYELLGEDMDGLLTEFVAEIPPDQLQMTIRERLKFQEDLAVRLVLDKADEMMEVFRRDQQQALQFLENLPEE